jgi:hypothetical protein
MTNKLKRLTKNVKDDTASIIASRWLNSASQIILDGGKPTKLTPTVSNMVAWQFEPDHRLADYKYTDTGAKEIADKAVLIARQYLEMGMHPEVLTYFANNR